MRDEGETCEGCEWSQAPELWPENEDAWRLWNAGFTQWRVGFGGRIGLDYPAVKLVAETLEPRVEWTGRTLRLIQALETYELMRKPLTDTEQDADHG